jgi:hypothetical protein
METNSNDEELIFQENSLPAVFTKQELDELKQEARKWWESQDGIKSIKDSRLLQTQKESEVLSEVKGK